MKLTRTATALAIALLSATALSACAPAANDAAPADSTAAGTATTQDADSNTSNDAASGDGWSIAVDGTDIALDDATVTCQDLDGTLAIAITSPSAADQAIGITLQLGDPITVQAVGLVDADGNALAYADGAGMGSASATAEGDTYTITGEGVVTDLNNPTSIDTKPFEVTVTCS